MEVYCHGGLLSWRFTVMEVYCHGGLLSWRFTVMEVYCHGGLLVPIEGVLLGFAGV